MALSNDIISQFVELTKTSDKIQNEASVYGTIVTDGNNTYVKLDGSEQLTPIETTTNVAGGERVIVRIKDHKATVTGNITSPSVNNGQLEDVRDQISEFEVVIADRVTANEIVVGQIEADNVIINKKLTAIEGEFETIKADNITINEELTANKAAIADLDAKKLSAETADLKYATIGGLNATNAEINDLKANHAEFSEATIKRLEADEASINKLDAEKLSAEDADIKYANIDFANINMAAVEKLFAESGIIKDLVVGDTSITGELVGVTIKGDLIEANTLVADKLVIKGSDGLYYKLNTDGMTTEAEQTEYNSLNGSIITAKSITATKISVDDLVAFDATIGGFNISSNSIYSGVKSSVDNTTKGIYLDKDGQIAFGDSNNFLKFFRDTDGKWKLNISANSLKFSTSDKTVEEVIEDIDTKVQKTVKTVADYYASSSSATTKPITGWQTTPPEWVNGKFIWAKTKTTYTDGTSSESDPVCITGAKGDTGKPGADGSSGVGISSVDIEYYLSTSSTTLAGGSWSTNSPTWVDGKYMWSRTKTTTTDGKLTTSEPVCITGGKGATGSNGVTGQGVESITEEYYLSTSKTTQSGGSWTTTPPIWSSGKYLWTRSEIIYKNPTETAYTKPVCDNSWEAVNEIEIGGRNLLQNSNFAFGLDGWYKHDYHTVEIVKDSTYGNVVKMTALDNNTGGIFKVPTVNFKNEEVYTMSVYIKSSVVGSQIGIAIDGNGLAEGEIFTISVANEWVNLVSTFKTSGVNPNIRVYSVKSSGCIFHITNIKVEKGNKPTDWTPAPEDVEANINNLEDTMNGAFKDGILSDAEKKSIKQSLNIIKGDAEEVQRQYDVVYKNSNLIGTAKTELLNSKTSYNSAYSSLISFINTALNAGIVTTAMINSIDSAFDTYRSALGTFNKKLQEAIDAINSNKIDNIKIGGENLIFREKYWQTTTPTVVQLTAEPEHSRIRIKKVTADEAKHTYLNFVKTLTKGKTYTLSYDIYTDMPITSERLLFLRCNRNGQALQYMKDQTVSSINTWIHKELTFVCNHSGTDDISIDSLALSTSHFNEGQTILFRNIKIEEGNKATTYSYAPEDERLEASRAGVNMLPNTKLLTVTGVTGVNYKYESRQIVTAINLKPFTIYTVSFKCKVLSGTTTKCSIGVTNSKLDVVYQRGDLVITDDRMSWTFYTRNATNCSKLLFYAGLAGQTGTNKLEYSEIMLEETSVASEKWIPNAGDVDYVIESKKVAINNLILNTKNMKDTSGWTGNIGVTRSGVLNEPVFYNITTTTSEAVSGTSRFRVKPNTKYCFSMLLNINYSCSSVDVWWIAKFKNSTNDYDNTMRFIAEWQEARDEYTRVVGTFVTGPKDYDGYIRIDNNGKLASATGNSSIYWTEAMVAEGDVFSGYSPSIKDMDLRVTKAESDLTVVNNAITAKVWGEDINVALGRQADNLVRNGNGGTKDNSNFSKCTFVGDVRGSKDYPSFLKGTSPYLALNDDRIYIDRSKDYILSYEIRAKLADAKNKIYFAIDCYDIDGYSIQSYNNLFISKTTTKLKKELNNGDMTIEVESLSNWLTASSIPAYQRSVIFWNYKDSTGYQYPKETYSRNSQEKFGNGLWDSISDEDKSSGIIRLKNPWSGGSYPIGTEISQGNSGATYMYVGAFGVVSFNDRWIPYNVTVPGSSFRPGTAFIKMGLYGGQPTYISNLYFGIDRATSGQLNDLSNTVTNVQKTVSQHTIDLSGITSKVEKIESSDFQVHNLQRHSGGKYKDAGIEAWSMSGKDTLSWFTNYGSPGTFEDYYDLYKGGSSGGIYAYSQSPIPVTAGEKYTVSFNYGRSAVGGATHRFVIQCSNTYPFGSVTQNIVDRYMPSTQANTIIRQEFQFTIPSGTKSIKVALVNSVSGADQSCSFYIDKIMINKGEVAYDWSPHEYDIESQFKSVEQKITAESILTTISSGINGNKGSINTMQFLLDKDGATIRNGALKILNNAGRTVLSGDSNGNLSVTGVYKNVNSRNLTSFKIADSAITFFDGRSEGEKMGTIFSGYMQTSPDKATSLTIGHYLDASLRLAYGKADSNGAILFYPYVELDFYNINGRANEKVGYPITIIQPVIIQEKSMVCSPMAFDNWKYNGRLEFYDYRLYGSDLSLGSVLNGRVKGSTSDIGDMCFLGRRGSNPKANAYAVLGQMLEGSSYDYNRNVVTSSSGTTVYGNFYVNGGTKNRIVTTNDFGVVKMNAYETSGCYFGDIGNGLIGEDGTCIIAMDIIYLETVNTKCDYFVFLQKYGSGDLWVEDRDETYFIVKGTPGMKFAWEVKARQRGYETDRLDQKLEDDGPATTYGCELTDRSQEEMEKLLKSMEEE